MNCFRLLLAAACLSLVSVATPQTPATPEAKPPAAAKPELAPGLYATLLTSMGSVTARLHEKESPITVKNFVDLALGRKAWKDPKSGQTVKRPLYNGLTFHRVIPGFMIQGGDPLGTGTGGTEPIPDELNPGLSFDAPGKFGMANSGPNTGSCQFFITEVPTPHLNGLHTIFGEVVEGMDVVEKIARTPRGANDRPTTPVRMVKVSVRRVGPGAPVTPAKAKPAVSKPKTVKPKTAKPKAAQPATGAPKAKTAPAP